MAARGRYVAALVAFVALLAPAPAASAVMLVPRDVLAAVPDRPTAAAATLRRQVRIGIGDQKPEMFGDPRFLALGVHYARLVIGWDAMRSSWQVAELDAWLQGARAAGVQPLISIGHSRTHHRSLPKPARLRAELHRLRKRYPWVRTFSTWNEANHCGEPTCHRPKLVAAYYRALRAGCPKCTILAPELLDEPNETTFARRFVHALGFAPAVWGVHNYIEANRFKTKRLRTLLRALPHATIWLTETGGLVRRQNASTTDFPEGTRHAGDVTRFLFDRVLPENPRIRAVYLYHWNAGPADATWDSGLINPRGDERSALKVLRRVLRAGPRADASRRPPAG